MFNNTCEGNFLGDPFSFCPDGFVAGQLGSVRLAFPKHSAKERNKYKMGKKKGI